MLKRSNRICLFVHYNQSEQISSYVLHYLKELDKMGFEILFISNSPIKEECRRALINNTNKCKIFERENKGADFGAWAWAFKNNLVPDYAETILLTNDSVFGPLFSLESIFDDMESKEQIDFWGLTDSHQGTWHIQSFFLVVSRKVFQSSSFKRVFQHDFSNLNKLQIIKKGEIELTKSLTVAGFKGVAYIPCSQLTGEVEVWDTKNPTHFFWDVLIEKYHFPFVKKELILQNPENIQNTDKIFSIIEKNGNYPAATLKEAIQDYIAISDRYNSFEFRVSIICHLYYASSIYYFLTRLLALKSPSTRFVFNLSATLYHNLFVMEMIVQFFPNSIIIYTPNQGRDIGGKLAAWDILMKTGIESDYSLIIHDKLSPHTPTGTEWRNKLLKIIEPNELPKIFKKFRTNTDIGIITVRDFIKNEYHPDKEKFLCTSNLQLLNYMKRYNLSVSNYNFAAGTIFWIRSSILQSFFSIYPPLTVRKEFEKGNVLDFEKGTNIHAWERVFSFITHSQGFKIEGI